MNILVIGDVVGHPGRSVLKKALPIVFKKHDIVYCIANIENAAGGFDDLKTVIDWPASFRLREGREARHRNARRDK